MITENKKNEILSRFKDGEKMFEDVVSRITLPNPGQIFESAEGILEQLEHCVFKDNKACTIFYMTREWIPGDAGINIHVNPYTVFAKND